MNIEEDIIYDGNPLVIDNFLFDEELKRLQDKIIFNLDFTFSPVPHTHYSSTLSITSGLQYAE